MSEQSVSCEKEPLNWIQMDWLTEFKHVPLSIKLKRIKYLWIKSNRIPIKLKRMIPKRLKSNRIPKRLRNE